MRHTPAQKQPLTLPLLSELCKLCDSLPATGCIYRMAFLLAFFGFLQQSNICPKSQHDFDVTRHTCRGNIKVSPPGLIVSMKWTKTLQVPGRPVLTHILAIPGHVLDTVGAFAKFCQMVPTGTCCSHFSHSQVVKWLPATI